MKVLDRVEAECLIKNNMIKLVQKLHSQIHSVEMRIEGINTILQDCGDIPLNEITILLEEKERLKTALETYQNDYNKLLNPLF